MQCVTFPPSPQRPSHAQIPIHDKLQLACSIEPIMTIGYAALALPFFLPAMGRE
jgi:hypothetical protein